MQSTCSHSVLAVSRGYAHQGSATEDADHVPAGDAGRSPDTATLEDLRAFQLDMSDNGTGLATFDNRLSILGFFFSVTCARDEMKGCIRYQCLAKEIPVVPSDEEIVRIHEAVPGRGLKYRAVYGDGLRASEVTHLRVRDIDRDRMLIRVD